MTDNLAQSDPNDHRGVTLQTESAQDNHAGTVTSVIQYAAISPIIWTPRFIILFYLLLASGLSGANMLTTGWLNQDYPAGWILIAYAVVNLGGWIAVNKCARSPLVRLGSIFGCLWAILMGLTFALSIFPIEPYAILLINTTAAASSALLACFICLSSARTPLQRWDRCFFVLAPIIGGTLVAVSFLYAPAKLHSFLLLKEYIVTAELWICTAIWWLRVSCWRRQLGPTLLLGIAPVIQIMLMQPANTYNETIVFFSQVMLLSIALGTLRILQCERCH